jgi:hypothetical protein
MRVWQVSLDKHLEIHAEGLYNRSFIGLWQDNDRINCQLFYRF